MSGRDGTRGAGALRVADTAPRRGARAVAPWRRRALTALLASIPFAVSASASVPAPGSTAGSSEPALLDFRLFNGERAELRIGPTERWLNLDPEVVSVELRDPGVLVVTGLRSGIATLRIWGGEGARAVRWHVMGLRPPSAAGSARRGADRPGEDAPGVHWRHASTHFVQVHEGAATGLGGLEGAVDGHEVEARLVGSGGARIWIRAWLEGRGRELEVPHLAATLERPASPGAWGKRLDLGHLDLDWGAFGFTRERLRGARASFASGRSAAARPRLEVEVVAGEDAPDFVRLGSRFVAPDPGRDRLGGALLRWRPREALDLAASWQVRDDGATGLRWLGEAAGSLRRGRMGLDIGLASDGRRMGTTASGRGRWAGNDLRLEYRRVDAGLDGLRGGLAGQRGPGIQGSRRLSAAVSRSFGTRARLDLQGSTAAIESYPTAPGAVVGGGCVDVHSSACDSGIGTRRLLETPSGGAVLDLTLRPRFALRLEGLWSEPNLAESRWRQRSGALELRWRDDGGADRKVLHWGTSLRWEARRDEATGLAEGEYAGQALRLGGHLGAGSWLGLSGQYETRWAARASSLHRLPAVWDGQVSLRLTTGRLPFTARATVGARRWDGLDLVRGRALRGRHRTAGVELETRPWRGLTLAAEGHWSEDVDDQRRSGRLQVSLRSTGSTLRPSSLPAGVALAARPAAASGASGRRTVQGRVFLDADADGVADPGERGVAGVELRSATGIVATTDPDGRFRFPGRLPAGEAVRLVDASIPKSLVPTAPTVSAAGAGGVGGMAFGLGPAPLRLAILAFQDVDGDGRRGEAEALLGGVELRLSGTTLRTRAEGLVAGEVPVAARLEASWSAGSIPAGHQAPAGRLRSEFTPAPGDELRLELPLVPLRSARGVIWLDADGSGRRDPGEDAAAGVVVRAGPRIAVTDAEGRFTLKALPAGPVEIAAAQSVPAGWHPSRPTVVTMNDGPHAITDLAIALERDPPVR